MDAKKYIAQLVEAGKDKKEAETFVNAVIAKIKEVMPDATPETQESVFLLKLDDILHGSSGDPFVGICIGMDKLEDSNRYQKDQALEAFKKDSNAAVMKGFIKVGEDGTPIPLDSKQFLDKAETKKNNNFGKPLPTRISRQMAFIVDGRVIRAFGKETPEIGKAYDFKASVTQSGYYTIVKDSMKPCATQPNATDLWDVVYSAAGQSDMVTALCDIKNANKNTFVITKGLVKHTAETTNGGAMIVLIDGDCEEGVVGFSASDEATGEILHEIVKGQEVISFGRVAHMKDGRVNLVTFGCIPNPASSGISAGLDALGDISI